MEVNLMNRNLDSLYFYLMIRKLINLLVLVKTYFKWLLIRLWKDYKYHQSLLGQRTERTSGRMKMMCLEGSQRVRYLDLLINIVYIKNVADI